MSNKGDENQKPLMYIVQPSYDESAPAMQNIVRKRKKSEKPSETKKSDKEHVIEESVQELVSQEVNQKTEEPPALQQEREINQEKDNAQKREPVQEQQPKGVFHETKEEPRRKRVKKPLSQMNIEEKVDFLTSLPHNMPRALCLIEADGKTYRGIIMERQDNMVVIRTAGGSNPVELAIGDISSIHPLGF